MAPSGSQSTSSLIELIWMKQQNGRTKGERLLLISLNEGLPNLEIEAVPVAVDENVAHEQLFHLVARFDQAVALRRAR